MTIRSNDELQYYAGSLTKIRNKKYEFFIISRIIHLLNDSEIEFTTQQLIRTGEGRFLLDLYFPQLKIVIEIDESYHTKEHQIAKDKARDRAIVDQSNVKVERVSIAEKTFEEVISETDRVICVIRKEKLKLESCFKFAPFVYGQKYDTEHWLKKGVLSVGDDARFLRHVDVAKLFGKNLKAHRRAMIKLSDDQSVWFPKLYENQEWDNSLSFDGKKIEMEKKSDGQYNSKILEKIKFYVFAHHRDEFGRIYYAFKGVFTATDYREGGASLRRDYDAIKFDGKGWIQSVMAGAL